jgi:hypothetical protein
MKADWTTKEKCCSYYNELGVWRMALRLGIHGGSISFCSRALEHCPA